MFWLAEVFNGRYTQEELDRYEQWARQQRAEAVHQLFTAAGRGLRRAAVAAAGAARSAATGLGAAYRGLERWQRRRAAIRELSRLSDHMLKDIGLHRGDIRPVVDELLERPAAGSVDGDREARTELRVFTAPRHEGAPGAGSSAEDQQQRAA